MLLRSCSLRSVGAVAIAAARARALAGGTAFAWAAIVGALGCGSDYSVETTPIGSNVDHGSWSFEGKTDGVTANGDGQGQPDGADRAQGSDGSARGVGGAADACGAPCVADGDCLQGGAGAAGASVAQCQIGSCVAGCCKPAPAADGAACDDGDACTAPDLCQAGLCTSSPNACDDGLPCTADSCAPGEGCAHVPTDGWCLLDGACIGDGEAKDGAPCEVCAAAEAPLAWTAQPGCCAQDADCKAAGVCDLPTCDLATATCSAAKKLGCCESDAACADADPCTLETCDLATGVCAVAAKTCPDASACEPGACDPATGQCVTTVAPNHCAIGGSCLLAGAVNAEQPCLLCQPDANATAWTSQVGKSCDDGEVCTVDDVCSPQGACLGLSKGGCCKVDAHCQVYASPCVTAACDLQAHLCVKQEKPGCCEQGACCDPATNTQKPKGTMCAATIAALEFQCSGQVIRRREHYPGCTGSDPTVCSGDAAYSFAGEWSDVETCAADTQCVLIASGEKPKCNPKGSCQGVCGGWAAGNACSCSPGCEAAGTCCGDYKAQCACGGGACCSGGLFAAKGASCGGLVTEFQCSGKQVQKRDGSAACNGASASCPSASFGGWTTVQTCPSTATCVAAADKSSATCQAGGGQTCQGKCGGQGTGGCWCDTACTGLGDCCPDFSQLCKSGCGAKPATSCSGKCGGQGVGGCWCDAACVDFGDCCPDKPVCCG